MVTELEITVLPLEWAFGVHSCPAFGPLLPPSALFPMSCFEVQGFLLLKHYVPLFSLDLNMSSAETSSGQEATSVLTLSSLPGQCDSVVLDTQEPIDLAESSDMAAL